MSNLVDEATRDVLLNKIGFNNWDEYQRSNLWNIICRHIQDRDAYFCRIRYCRNRTKSVRHLNYNLKSLMGLEAYHILTICPSCIQKIEYDEDASPRSLVEQQTKTFELLVNIKFKEGVSNPEVGRWYRNNIQQNIPIAKQITEELKLHSESYLLSKANHVALRTMQKTNR